MARQARLTLAGEPHLVAQSAPTGQPLHADADDAQAFVEALRHASRETRTALHGWVLLPEQLVLLATPSSADGIGRMMQRLGRRYVRRYNERHGREGALWDQRFRSGVLESEPWTLLALRYLEDLPVQRGLVQRPQDHPWSSAGHHVAGRADPLVTEPASYWRLGNTPFEREAAYTVLMQQGLDVPARAALDIALSRGQPLGSSAWLAALERTTGRPTQPRRPGRRPKTAQSGR